MRTTLSHCLVSISSPDNNAILKSLFMISGVLFNYLTKVLEAKECVALESIKVFSKSLTMNN